MALNNGIYTDEEGHSRSAVHLLISPDGGRSWDYLCPAPILRPHGDGWERAFVYAFDARRVNDSWWLFYNARDDWADGWERIGLARLDLPAGKSLDDLPLFSGPGRTAPGEP